MPHPDAASFCSKQCHSAKRSRIRQARLPARDDERGRDFCREIGSLKSRNFFVVYKAVKHRKQKRLASNRTKRTQRGPFPQDDRIKCESEVELQLQTSPVALDSRSGAGATVGVDFSVPLAKCPATSFTSLDQGQCKLSGVYGPARSVRGRILRRIPEVRLATARTLSSQN